MRGRKIFLFGLVCLGAAGAVLADEHQLRHRVTNPPTFRVNGNMVLVRVSVVDSFNHPVLGLAREQFQVFDDNVLQEIKAFGTEEDPVSVGFVFDASSSMETVLGKSRQAVTEVCRGSDRQDEYFLITFANRALPEVDFTPDCGEIQHRLLWVPAKGDTSLIDGTYLAFQELRRAHNSHKALILVSDGGENASRYSAGDLKAIARETDAQLYAVGIGSFKPEGPVEEEQGPELMSDLARSTGGRYFAVGRLRDLPEVARQIADELRNEYVIGYNLSGPNRSSQYHTVSIKIRRNPRLPRYSAFWRRQYFYPKH